jgi:hypothetical protein
MTWVEYPSISIKTGPLSSNFVVRASIPSNIVFWLARDHWWPLETQRVAELIVSKVIRLGTTIVPEKRDDTQLTSWTAWDYQSSRSSFQKVKKMKNLYWQSEILVNVMIMSSETPEKHSLPNVLHGLVVHEIECLDTKFNETGPILLLFDGCSTHVIPHVAGCPRSWEVLIIRLILHSPHLSQTLICTCSNDSKFT